MKTRVVHTKFWQDNFICSLNHKEKLLFLYLITNDRVNISGVYELPDKTIKNDVEMTEMELEKAKEKFHNNKKFVFFNGWIKIINLERYQNYTGEKNDVCRAKELEKAPPELQTDTLSIPYRYPTDSPSNKKSEIRNKKLVISNKKEVIELTKLLFNLVCSNYPFVKKKEIVQANYDDIEKLNSLDGYSFDIIRAVIDWSQKDDFWKQNIRSTKKLREKFEQLLVKVSGKLNERKVVNFDK